MLRWKAKSSFPLGPSANTFPSATRTLTPAGTGTGCLPTRDMVVPLPDGTQQLAADLLGPGAAVAHDAPAGAEDADPQPVQHRAELVVAAVEPPARPAGALDVTDDALPLGAVLEEDA